MDEFKYNILIKKLRNDKYAKDISATLSECAFNLNKIDDLDKYNNEVIFYFKLLSYGIHKYKIMFKSDLHNLITSTTASTCRYLLKHLFSKDNDNSDLISYSNFMKIFRYEKKIYVTNGIIYKLNKCIKNNKPDIVFVDLIDHDDKYSIIQDYSTGIQYLFILEDIKLSLNSNIEYTVLNKFLSKNYKYIINSISIENRLKKIDLFTKEIDKLNILNKIISNKLKGTT